MRRTIFTALLSVCLYGLMLGLPAAALQDLTVSSPPASPTNEAGIPKVIKFAGRLQDTDGKALVGLTVVKFSLFRTATNGEALWQETQEVNADSTGRYSVLLGSSPSSSLPTEIFADGEARWLQIEVAGIVPEPRTFLVSVPYAMTAANAQKLGGLEVGDFLLTKAAREKLAAASAATGAQQAQQETFGAISSSANTTGFLAKFTATDTIGNSSIFENNGFVGFGTTSPGANMHLKGGGQQMLRIDPDTTSQNLVEFYRAGVPKWLWYMTGTDDFRFWDTTDRVTFRAGGNVGIGTVSPNAKLHIAGAGQMLRIDPNSTSQNIVEFYVAGVPKWLWYITSGGDFRVWDTTDRVTFQAGGNVGIGTTNPTTRLEVAGAVKSTTGGFVFPDASTQTTAGVTSLTAGTGITVGTGSTPSVAVNTTAIQARVTGTCATGQYVMSIAQNGSVTCGTDATGTGGGGNPTTPFTVTGSNTTGIITGAQTNSTITQPAFPSSFPPAGIIGDSTATSDHAAGILGKSASDGGFGVMGINTSTTVVQNGNGPIGVLGAVRIAGGIGVNGSNDALTGVAYGVQGNSSSSSGVGIAGEADSNSGNTVGVQGIVQSASGTAGLFLAPGGSSSFVLRGSQNGGLDVFKVDGNGTVFASAYRDLNGSVIPASGDGSALTNLNASNLATGTIPSGRLSGTYSNAFTFSNATNSFTGAGATLSANNAGNYVLNVQNTASGSGNGISAISNDGIGVFGTSSTNSGVHGNSNSSSFPGVRGVTTNANGDAIRAESNAGGDLFVGRALLNDVFVVNSTGLVTTKSVSGASMVSDKTILPALAFTNLVTTAGTIVNKVVKSQGILDNNGSVTTNAWQSLLLDNGIVITGLKVCGTDNDNPGEITARLYRKSYLATSSFGAPELIASANSGTTAGSTTAQCFSSTNLNTSLATVTNGTYYYYVEIEMTNFVQIMAVEIDH
jgi:hypothetical protein